MKKFITLLCIATLMASTAEARHSGGHHHVGSNHGYYTIPHKHHHGNAVAGFVAGLIGGSILNYAINQPQSRTITTTYAPISYTPAVVTAPVINTQVVSSSTVVTNTQPCYTTTNIVTGQSITQCSSIISSAPVVTQIITSN